MPSRPVRLRPRDFLKIIAAKFYFLIVFSYDVSFNMCFSVGFALNCRSFDISPPCLLVSSFYELSQLAAWVFPVGLFFGLDLEQNHLGGRGECVADEF